MVLFGHQGVLELGSQKSSGSLKLPFSLNGSLLYLIGNTILYLPPKVFTEFTCLSGFC